MSAVFFDLDGTLVDSARDLGTAVNRMLDDLGMPRRSLPEVRRFIGDGVVKLIERAVGDGRAACTDIEAAVARFRAHYADCLLETTDYFPGIRALIDGLEVPLAVVSNKPEDACIRLIDALDSTAAFSAIAGGDSFPVRKPDPTPILETARRIGVPPTQIIFVGDGEQDMRAGRAAGCRTIGVLWGQGDAETLTAAGADLIVEDVFSLEARIRSTLSGP